MGSDVVNHRPAELSRSRRNRDSPFLTGAHSVGDERGARDSPFSTGLAKTEETSATTAKFDNLSLSDDVEKLREQAEKYYTGDEVPRSTEKAAQFYHKAADLGCPRSAFSLADLYMKGDGQ